MSAVLAIDARPGGVTALVVSGTGEVIGRGRGELARRHPWPGWAEQALEDVWRATLAACREALRDADAAGLVGIGIAGERDSVALWDRETLGSPRPALVREAGPDPRFWTDRLAWLREHEPHPWALVEAGRYAVGTVVSYLVARMTRGTWHVADVSSASRTLLLDPDGDAWSSERCALLGLPPEALPDVVASWGGTHLVTDARSFLGLSLPIAGLAGDQPAALFGQACFRAGDAACTYGAESVVLAHAGTSPSHSAAALTSVAAWRSPDGETTYALEGSVRVADTVTPWPRPTLEEVASGVAGVLADLPQVTALRVGGAPAEDDLLCRLQADRSGVEVSRPRYVEAVGLGAAYLAGLGAGVWSSYDEIGAARLPGRGFRPGG